MTYRQVVYFILDHIKAMSDDSIITPEHVIWIINRYRGFLLHNKYVTEKLLGLDVSETDKQLICIDLEKKERLSGFPCEGYMLRSTKAIPSIIDGTTPNIITANIFASEITFISERRMHYIGYNKWLKNMLYATIFSDNYLYLLSPNPQLLYLSSVKMAALFTDPLTASELTCSNSDDESDCTTDILEVTFPLDDSLMPQLIQLTTSELLSAQKNEEDKTNDANDNISPVANGLILNKNFKSTN